MKKIIIYIAVIALLAACAKTPSFKITGEIKNQEGTIYLTHVVDGERVKADSAELVEGKFTFMGTVNGPEYYRLTFKSNQYANIPIIIENSVINFQADMKNPAANEITGSASQDVLNKYNKLLIPFNEKADKILKHYSEAYEAKDDKKVEEILAEYEKNEDNKKAVTMKFIKDNNKTFAAALLASQQRIEDADKIDELVASLDPSLMDHNLVIGMKEKANALRKVAIGKMAPDFTMDDPEGNSITLSSLFGKGYILVDFWASWCGPCRGENPNVVIAYNKYHDKGFEILGVSYDDNKEKWLEAIEKDQLSWKHVSDLKAWGNLTQKLYCISGIPSNVLLDKEGKIIAKNLRGEALTEKLAELLD